MKKQFKAESKRLLDLMINSIYTHKEIFLRELISNASDAIDKRYYLALTGGNETLNREDLKVRIELNKEERTITISDNGIGMDKEGLEDNLGVIAKSGSLEFKSNLSEEEEVADIIGQFGVGFYSAFMVAKKVTVNTRAVTSDTGFQWVSEGEDGYTIKKIEKDRIGTEIILSLKESTEGEDYDQYLESYTIQNLVKKYSDYIRYPIEMDLEKSIKVEGSEDQYETVIEPTILNSMIPIWKKNKSEISEEEYQEFYKNKFMDWTNPLKVIHTSVEGTVSFDALLFIPASTPYNYYTKEYEKGLQLYSRNVFIMDNASELVPEHFRFVKGLVDSQDLSLNISREMLQHDRQLQIIAGRLEKKIKSELAAMLKNERDTYEQFWKNFGLQIKYGVYSDYGVHKELLQDLLLFYSSVAKKNVTLDEYIENMKEDQEFIYYVSGETVEKIDKLPQTELVKEKGFEVLYLTDEVDEFALQVMGEYKEKKFKSITQGDVDFNTEEEKQEIEKATEENKDLLTRIQESLTGKVKEVKVSSRLKSYPVCLSATEGISLEMEKVLNNMPDGEGVKAEKVLEINRNHPIFDALQEVYEQEPELIDEYSQLLYDQALLIEGFSIEDPIAFSNRVSELMVKANKK